MFFCVFYTYSIYRSQIRMIPTWHPLAFILIDVYASEVSTLLKNLVFRITL